MSVTVKRGAMVRISLELTQSEWDAIYPWDSIKSEAQQGETGRPGWVEHELTIAVDVPTRTLMLSANTTAWGFGAYKADVRAEVNGESVFLPPDSTLSITVVEGITE